MGSDRIRLHRDFSDATLLVSEQTVAVEDSTPDLILACDCELNLKRINLKRLNQPS